MAAMNRRSGGSAPSLSTGVIAAIAGASLGILVTLICIVALIVRARKSHKRLLTDLETRGIGLSRGPSIAEISDPNTNRTRTVLRKNSASLLYHTNDSGWDMQNSDSSLNVGQPLMSIDPFCPLAQPQSIFDVTDRRRTADLKRAFRWRFRKSKSFENPVGQGGPTSRLSAITEAFCESPRSQAQIAMPIIPDPDEEYVDVASRSSQAMDGAEREGSLDIARTSSPAFDVPALPARKPAALLNNTELTTIRLVQGSRSKSLAFLPSDGDGLISKRRPPMHQRSTSLCTQKSGHVPSAPAPPLPIVIDLAKQRNSLICDSPTRISVSSMGSAGSSILIHSPNPAMKRNNSATLGSALPRNRKRSVISGPRSLHPKRNTSSADSEVRRQSSVGSRASIGSSIARYSGVSFHGLGVKRSKSDASSLDNYRRLSAGEDLSTERAISNKISSVSPPGTDAQTPVSRRSSRFFVDAQGSPSTRRASQALQPLREGLDTVAQESSLQASAGSHKFSYEPSPMQSGAKPSALKGSPNSRKGHKRQNCVRISLAPTILGPSPPRMKKIQEEDPPRSDSSDNANVGDPRQYPVTHALTPTHQLNARRIRASLTASSPTLSLVNFCEDNGLPLEQLGLALNHSTPRKRASTVLSVRSPALSIPTLTTSCRDPIKRSFSATVMNLTMPGSSQVPPSPLSEDSGDDAYTDAPSNQTYGRRPKTNAKPDAKDNVATLSDLSSDDPRTSPKTRNSSHNDCLASSPPDCSTTDSDRSVEGPTRAPKLIAHSLPGSANTSSNPLWPRGKYLKTHNEATNPGSPRSITLAGPRPQPAKSLNKTVQMLRRMNSDVGHDYRAERRFLGLGDREASPTSSGALYRDSYADLRISPAREVTDIGRLTDLRLCMPDHDSTSDIEIDIDDMLRSSACGSDLNFELDDYDSQDWFNSDDTNPWEREDSGTLGSAERIERLYHKDNAGVMQQTARCATNDDLVATMEASSVWDDGERFWDLEPEHAEQPSHGRPCSAILPIPGLAITTTGSKSYSDAGGEQFHIPGLSLTTASPTTSPTHARGTFTIAGADDGDVGARSSWKLGGPTKKVGTTSSMRKDAILNLSSNAQNRQRRAERECKAGEDRQGNITPEPCADVMRREPGTPRSLYDEDGFLKG